MLVQLRYVLHILSQGSFLSEIKPFRWSHMTLSFLRKQEKTNSSLLFVKNRFSEVTDNLCDIPPIYLFPLENYKLCIHHLIRMAVTKI